MPKIWRVWLRKSSYVVESASTPLRNSLQDRHARHKFHIKLIKSSKEEDHEESYWCHGGNPVVRGRAC